MERSMIVWFVTVGIFAAVILTRVLIQTVIKMRNHRLHHAVNHHRHHGGIISIGEEREEFFVPGDPEEEVYPYDED